MAANGHLHGIRKSHRGGRALLVVFVLVTLLASGLGGLWASPALAHTVDDVTYDDQELEFFRLMNNYRATNGKSRLLLSDHLALSADHHGYDMGKYKFFSHRTGYNTAMTYALPGQRSDHFPKGSYPWDRMKLSGYNYYTSMGENIATGQWTALEVFNAFKASRQGHNEAMLSSYYKVVGISRVIYKVGEDEYAPYWVLDFGGYVDHSAHDSSLFELNDPRVNYLSSWSTRAAPAASAGSYSYTSKPGAAALVSFTGASVELWAATGPGYGKMLVSLDGGTFESVDLYPASDEDPPFKKRVFTRSGLDAEEPHTLTIVCSGEKNGASSGTEVNIDAVKVEVSPGMPGTIVQAPLAARHQQEEAALKYVGDWSTISSTNWLASGNSFAYANSPGAAVNVKFHGTYLAWVAKKGPWYGKAAVSLDGGTPVAVDLYSSCDKYKQRVYDTGVLEDGEHTLSIYWLGQKNPAAFDYRINIDTFDVFDDIVLASDPEPLTWLYEQDDKRITYLGLWSNRSATAASGGSLYQTSTPGAGALVSFTGTSVELLATKGPSYGKMMVSLDGGGPVTVDLYSSSEAYKQSVYTGAASGAGPHTLTIKCSDEKNNASSGWLIDVDALRVTGPLTQSAAPTRFQEDTPAGGSPTFEYTGVWNQALTWSASGGRFISSSDPAAEVTVTFTGTYLSWLARTAPWYGKAELVLDGDTDHPVIIDLYSASIGWKKAVYNTGLLADGPHTLTISWTGDKHQSSSGTAISMDAVDLMATTY